MPRSTPFCFIPGENYIHFRWQRGALAYDFYMLDECGFRSSPWIEPECVCAVVVVVVADNPLHIAAGTAAPYSYNNNTNDAFCFVAPDLLLLKKIKRTQFGGAPRKETIINHVLTYRDIYYYHISHIPLKYFSNSVFAGSKSVHCRDNSRSVIRSR